MLLKCYMWTSPGKVKDKFELECVFIDSKNLCLLIAEKPEYAGYKQEKVNLIFLN